MSITDEKDIERALGRMVDRHGGMSLKWVCPGWTGVPDRILLLPHGVVCFVETKRPKNGRVSAMQRWWSRRLQELGFQHRFVRNMEDILNLEGWVIQRLRLHRKLEREMEAGGEQ